MLQADARHPTAAGHGITAVKQPFAACGKLTPCLDSVSRTKNRACEHSSVAFALDVVVKYSVFVLLSAALVFAIVVPVYLRRNWSASPHNFM